jgi:hypothetical protein
LPIGPIVSFGEFATSEFHESCGIVEHVAGVNNAVPPRALHTKAVFNEVNAVVQLVVSDWEKLGLETIGTPLFEISGEILRWENNSVQDGDREEARRVKTVCASLIVDMRHISQVDGHSSLGLEHSSQVVEHSLLLVVLFGLLH